MLNNKLQMVIGFEVFSYVFFFFLNVILGNRKANVMLVWISEKNPQRPLATFGCRSTHNDCRGGPN